MSNVASALWIASLVVSSHQSGQKPRLVAKSVDTKLSIGKPLQVGTVAIIPIESTVPLSRDEYLTLAEATKLGLVEIVEMPGQEEVNSLEVRNKGKVPILLFAGELLLGGKQTVLLERIPSFRRTNGETFRSFAWNTADGTGSLFFNRVIPSSATASGAQRCPARIKEKYGLRSRKATHQ